MFFTNGLTETVANSLTAAKHDRSCAICKRRTAMSRLMLKSAKRASLIENLRSLRGLGKMRVR
jgi:plasmid rolling circle replication initiator protein Rep